MTRGASRESRRGRYPSGSGGAAVLSLGAPDALAEAPAPQAILARAKAENFPVALRLLGREERTHLMAIYGFARLVDWAGDEAPGDREAVLDAIERDLDRVFAGARAESPLLRPLAAPVEGLRLPDAPFRRLLAANRRDQRVRRYASFEELLGYCALSANPVGELVLHVFGAASPARVALSDRICTALQLAEHLQDVGEDARAGRVYLPQADLARFGCDEAELRGASAGPALRALLAFEAGRARALLREGAPLLATLRGRTRLAVAGFAAGGHAALDAVERAGADGLGTPPRARRRDLVRHGMGLLLGARRAGRP